MRLGGRLAIAATMMLGGCGLPFFQPPLGAPPAELQVEAAAARWAPLAVSDLDAIPVAAPPAPDSAQFRAELDELKAMQARRGDADLQEIAAWNAQAAPLPWSAMTDQMLIDAGTAPPRAARALAIVHAAMFDATVATWKAKATYSRAIPKAFESSLSPLAGEEGVPSYPSEHAAIAGAASAALAYLFPERAADLEAQARKAAESRLMAGANLRSDVEAGLALGKEVAKRITAKSETDGSDQPRTGNIPAAAGQWGHAKAMEPHAGSWRTWLLDSGSQFRLDPPAAADSPELQADLAEVQREVASLTQHPWKLEQARYWNFDVPAIIWSKRAQKLSKVYRLNTPQAARVLAVLAAIEADTFIACWDSKYVIRRPRPSDLDPTLPVGNGDRPAMPFPTPPHPSYPSGHSAASMAAATYLATVFPDDALDLFDDANQAAMSRLYAGIHYRSDNADGLIFGKRCAEFMMGKLKARGTI
ncbi:PAP2 superfamily protein [compost metagenome]